MDGWGWRLLKRSSPHCRAPRSRRNPAWDSGVTTNCRSRSDQQSARLAGRDPARKRPRCRGGINQVCAAASTASRPRPAFGSIITGKRSRPARTAGRNAADSSRSSHVFRLRRRRRTAIAPGRCGGNRYGKKPGFHLDGEAASPVFRGDRPGFPGSTRRSSRVFPVRVGRSRAPGRPRRSPPGPPVRGGFPARREVMKSPRPGRGDGTMRCPYRDPR